MNEALYGRMEFAKCLKFDIGLGCQRYSEQTGTLQFVSNGALHLYSKDEYKCTIQYVLFTVVNLFLLYWYKICLIERNYIYIFELLQIHSYLYKNVF